MISTDNDIEEYRDPYYARDNGFDDQSIDTDELAYYETLIRAHAEEVKGE